MSSKIERMAKLLNRLAEMSFSYSEAKTLRRIEMTLRRWAEQECGDGNDRQSWAIERDEATGKPFLCIYPHNGPSRRAPVADRERGALDRLRKLMANHPELTWYHQTDPRGCALYILRKADVAGQDVSSIYNRGVAVCS